MLLFIKNKIWRTRWWRSRWTWITSFLMDTSAIITQTEKCMQDTSWRQKGVPDQWNFPQFIVIHRVKGFGIVNKAEIDVFLELSCFFHHPEDVGNLISGSSAFSKTSLNIRKFSVHVLLKPGLENFEHYFTSMWDECNHAVVWAWTVWVFIVIFINTVSQTFLTFLPFPPTILSAWKSWVLIESLFVLIQATTHCWRKHTFRLDFL